MKNCHYCGPTNRDLRPYGPGGAAICFPCMTTTPEREGAAGAVFEAVLNAAEAMSPVGATINGGGSGPHPYVPGDERMLR